MVPNNTKLFLSEKQHLSYVTKGMDNIWVFYLYYQKSRWGVY